MLPSVFDKKILNIFNLILAIINRMLYNISGGDTMTIEQKIKMALSYAGISQAEYTHERGIGADSRCFRWSMAGRICLRGWDGDLMVSISKARLYIIFLGLNGIGEVV